MTDSSGAVVANAKVTLINKDTNVAGTRITSDDYEFLRNDKLNARNFFDAQELPYRQNQFGGSFGGPMGGPARPFREEAH